MLEKGSLLILDSKRTLQGAAVRKRFKCESFLNWLSNRSDHARFSLHPKTHILVYPSNIFPLTSYGVLQGNLTRHESLKLALYQAKTNICNIISSALTNRGYRTRFLIICDSFLTSENACVLARHVPDPVTYTSLS